MGPSTASHRLPLVAGGQIYCRGQGRELGNPGGGGCTGPTRDDEGWTTVGTMDMVRNSGIFRVHSLGDQEGGERTLPLGAHCGGRESKPHQSQDF